MGAYDDHFPKNLERKYTYFRVRQEDREEFVKLENLLLSKAEKKELIPIELIRRYVSLSSEVIDELGKHYTLKVNEFEKIAMQYFDEKKIKGYFFETVMASYDLKNKKIVKQLPDESQSIIEIVKYLGFRDLIHSIAWRLLQIDSFKTFTKNTCIQSAFMELNEFMKNFSIREEHRELLTPYKRTILSSYIAVNLFGFPAYRKNKEYKRLTTDDYYQTGKHALKAISEKTNTK